MKALPIRYGFVTALTLVASFLSLALAPLHADAGLNPYWFSWNSSDCSSDAVDPVSTYFAGSGAKGGRVKNSLIHHLGAVDPRWYEWTDETKHQWFRHYNGACLEGDISIANAPGDSERMHIRGLQVASPPSHAFTTGLTPHYELYVKACGGHVIAYNGAPTRDGGHVRNGGYVYARIKLEQAYGNGRRRAFRFHFFKRPDSRKRRTCGWTVADGGTVVQITYGDP